MSKILSKSNTNWLKQETVIHGIKIIDIGYITTLYFLSGYLISYHVNFIYGTFDPATDHNIVKLVAEICMQLFVIGVIVYVLRKLIPLIPFPLNGIWGFEHSRVKELTSGGVSLSFGVFQAQIILKDKIEYLLKKLGH